MARSLAQKLKHFFSPNLHLYSKLTISEQFSTSHLQFNRFLMSEMAFISEISEYFMKINFISAENLYLRKFVSAKICSNFFKCLSKVAK